jgi:hypothetical protein
MEGYSIREFSGKMFLEFVFLSFPLAQNPFQVYAGFLTPNLRFEFFARTGLTPNMTSVFI